MARKIFFSFHYERDAWRAGQVRNCNMLPSEDQVGFIDAVDWESIKKQGSEAIKRWIAKQLNGTSATAVLIGSETAGRGWVQHEILESWNRGNGVFGIWIHNVKDVNKNTDTRGANPFESFKLPDGTLLSTVCKMYDWVQDEGRDRLGTWADEAARIRALFGADKKIEFIARIEKSGNGLGAAAAVAGAVALGGLVAAALRDKVQTPAPVRSSGFAPRSPWCANRDFE
jgi:hypothetical protein